MSRTRAAWTLALALGPVVACRPNPFAQGDGGTGTSTGEASTSTGAAIEGTSSTGATGSDTEPLVAETSSGGSTDAGEASTSTGAGTSPGTSTGEGGTTEAGPSVIEYCEMPMLAISDADPMGVESSLTVDLIGGGIVVSVALTIVATHTYVGDLRFDLRKDEADILIVDHPGGAGCNGNDIDATFEDAAVMTIDASCLADGRGTPALSGSLLPQTAMDPIFGGQQMLGTWRLRSADTVGGDTGTLVSWCLRITYQ